MNTFYKIKRLLIEWWKKSKIFNAINSMISNHYRKKLKNNNFTILCSNCVGGVLYHRLGKEFLSPTINMFFTNPDFAEFCLHLDYYLAQKLHFIETEYDFPVAELIGDGNEIQTITLYFNHDKIIEEAEEKWERRKKRINRENLYIMLYNLDNISDEKIKELEAVECKNRVIFTATPLPDISWSYYIEPNMKAQYPYAYLGKDILGRRHVEKAFDFVEFFNS